MRLRKLTLHNIKPYPGDVVIDLEAIPGKLVALIAENGAGKTRLVESWPGAMYRKAPTHGPLAPWAAARDSFVEASFVNGSNWTIRQSLDAISGKGETLLLDGEGKAVLESTKVRDFDGWAASHLPAPEVFLSSLFTAQGTKGLLGEKVSDRKSIVLRALGVESLEAKAKAANAHKLTVLAQIEPLRARLEDERNRGGDTDAIEAEIVDLDDQTLVALKAIAAARAELDAAKIEVANHDRLKKEADDANKRHNDLQALLDQSNTRKADVERRVANNRAVLADAAAIRAADAKGVALEAEKLKFEQQLKGIADAEEALATRIAELSGTAVVDRARQAEERVQTTRKVIGEALAVDQAEAEVKRLEGVLAAAKAKFTECDQVLEGLRGQQIVGAEGRIEALRVGLDVIAAFAVDHPATTARATLDADNTIIKAAADLPAALAAATAARKAALDAERKADQDLADAQKSARRREAVDAARLQLPLDEQALQVAKAELDELTTKRADNQKASQLYQDQARDARTELQRVTTALTDPVLTKERDRVKPLETAEARLAEIEPHLAQCVAEVARLEIDLGASPVVPQPPSEPPALAPFNLKVTEAEAELTKVQGSIATAKQRLQIALTVVDRVADLEAELSKLETEHADWTKLADDLGKNGIQALLIDAAGPEISEISNDLLHRSFGPRYTISFETIRLSADGKKEIEDFDIKVIDTEQGRDAAGEEFSPGQQVPINEALSLGFTIFNCKRNGISRPTLIRDEAGAALSPENSVAYMNMLRRAMDIVDADKLIFISHNPETWELADNRILLTPEGVTIQ